MNRKAVVCLAMVLAVMPMCLLGCQKHKRESISVKVKDQDQEGVRFAKVYLEGSKPGEAWVVIDSALTDQNGYATFSPPERYPSYQVTVTKYGLAFDQHPVSPNRPLEVEGKLDIPPSAAMIDPSGDDTGDDAQATDAHLRNDPKGKSDKATSAASKAAAKAKTTPKKKPDGADRGKTPLPAGFAQLPVLERIRWYSSVNDPLGVLSTGTADLSGERKGEAYFYRAMAFAATEQSDSALSAYETVIHASPRLRPQALLNIGVLHMQKSRLDEAIKVFDEALSGQLSEEKRGLVYLNLGKCYYTGTKVSKQRTNYIASARQNLTMSRDLLCSGRIKGRDAECKQIDDLMKKLDQVELKGSSR